MHKYLPLCTHICTSENVCTI
uniref:Uncharacterized protein n=1 Tax=Anguilla anguilla TaxID=7936 RepID=A0A0E9PD01_ANGAN